ncbi:MAG: ATP-binding cassette domain-containing protein [Streptococcus sp.]
MTLCNNEKIALVGKNGAGKDSLVKIICGLYKPTKGKVLINGIDLEEIKLSNYQKLLATAFQDTYILPMSIAENIAFREATSNVEEIKRCLKMAGLDGEFWMKLSRLRKCYFQMG